MTTDTRPVEPAHVACEVCLKEIPRSEAAMAEARDYVAYFCGLDCYEKWKSGRAGAQAAPSAPEPGPEPEVQLGHDRSKAKDDRLKRALRQHPHRDEPRVDSVEEDETPRS
jgi:hypothetical protein